MKWFKEWLKDWWGIFVAICLGLAWALAEEPEKIPYYPSPKIQAYNRADDTTYLYVVSLEFTDGEDAQTFYQWLGGVKVGNNVISQNK